MFAKREMGAPCDSTETPRLWNSRTRRFNNSKHGRQGVMPPGVGKPQQIGRFTGAGGAHPNKGQTRRSAHTDHCCCQIPPVGCGQSVSVRAGEPRCNRYLYRTACANTGKGAHTGCPHGRAGRVGNGLPMAFKGNKRHGGENSPQAHNFD